MADATILNIGGIDYNVVDASVPSWAKQNTKPSYAANEISGLATVATSGSYNDLSNKPTIPSIGTLNTNNSTAQTASSSESFNGNINLHKISKTGSFNDLLNKPDIVQGISVPGQGKTPVNGIISLVDEFNAKEDAQKVLIRANITTGDNPTISFTDSNNNSLTHSEVHQLFENPKKDVVIERGDLYYILQYKDGSDYYYQNFEGDAKTFHYFGLQWNTDTFGVLNVENIDYITLSDIKFKVSGTINSSTVQNPTKNFNRIKSAYDAGKLVVFADSQSNYEYYCIKCNSSEATFFNSDTTYGLSTIKVTSSDVWSVSVEEIPDLSNYLQLGEDGRISGTNSAIVVLDGINKGRTYPDPVLVSQNVGKYYHVLSTALNSNDLIRKVVDNNGSYTFETVGNVDSRIIYYNIEDNTFYRYIPIVGKTGGMTKIDLDPIFEVSGEWADTTIENPTKTFAEIKAAIDSGKIAIFKDDGGYSYYANCCDNSTIRFFCSDNVSIYSISVTSSDVWTIDYINFDNLNTQLNNKPDVVFMSKINGEWKINTYKNNNWLISTKNVDGNIKNIYIDRSKGDIYYWDPKTSSFVQLDPTPGYKEYSNYSTMAADVSQPSGTIGFDGNDENFYIFNLASAEWKNIDGKDKANIHGDPSKSFMASYLGLNNGGENIGLRSTYNSTAQTNTFQILDSNSGGSLTYTFPTYDDSIKTIATTEDVDKKENKILDWTELPWWLNETNNSEKIDESWMNPSYSDYYPDVPLTYEQLTPIEANGTDILFSSRLNSIYGVRFSQTYLKDYEESNFTSELGKLINRYIGDRPAMEIFAPIVWDIKNGKVYRIKIYWGNGGITKFTVILVVDHQYNPDRIYSYPMSFGTKIYFKFRFTAEEIPSYISNPDEHDPSVWLYKINLVPVCHDTITYTPAFVNEPYMTDTEIQEGEDVVANTAHYLRSDLNGTTGTTAIASPCVYFDLGTVSVALRFRQDYFLSLWPGVIDLTNLPVVGRFTAGIDDLPIVMHGSLGEFIKISSSNPSIIQGHDYEYHFLNGVFNLIDITGTI